MWDVATCAIVPHFDAQIGTLIVQESQGVTLGQLRVVGIVTLSMNPLTLDYLLNLGGIQKHKFMGFFMSLDH